MKALICSRRRLSFACRLTLLIAAFASRPAFAQSFSNPFQVIVPVDQVWKYDQSGNDLGSAWKESGYDDSSWASGPGGIGIDDNPAVTYYLRTTLEVGPATYYFRTHFNYVPTEQPIELVSSNMVDDGVILYLNGHEAYRLNMPDFPVNYLTYASAPGREGIFFLLTVPSDYLVPGDNVLAAEVHQSSSTSADASFVFSLLRRLPAPTELAIVTQPEDVLVVPGADATFGVGVSGGGPYFRRYRDGVAIPGATSQSYVLTNAQVSDSGATFFVTASNIINSVTSETVTLTVRDDTIPPVLLGADGSVTNTQILATFSEPLLEETATNVTHFVLTNLFGGELPVLSAVLTHQTNVLLTTEARLPDANYLLLAHDVRDASPSENPIAEGAAVPVARPFAVMPFVVNWRFYDPYPGIDDPEPQADWNQPGADLAGWGFGPAAFVNDSKNRSYSVPSGTTLSGGVRTTYFVTSFPFTGDPIGARLFVRHLVDDGAVFYLNGEEVLRFNMPTGAVTALTAASAAIDMATPSPLTEVPADALHWGQNVLAVEVHSSADLEDSDKFFACELSSTVNSLAGGPVLITRRPEDQTGVEDEPVAFTFDAVGAGRFQWYRDGIALPGATEPILSVPVVPLAWDGSGFQVVAWNDSYSATSAVARLSLAPDVVPPALVSAWTGADPAEVTLMFSEPMNPASVTNLSHYIVSNGQGMRVPVLSASLVADAKVLLRVGGAAIGAVVTVEGLTDRAQAAHAIEAGSRVVVGFNGTLVPIGGWWQYTGVVPASDWTHGDFDASDWTAGQALIGYATVPLVEPIRSELYGGAFDGTWYFRTEFSVGDAITNGVLRLRQVIDDGAIFYLNGVEAFRAGMPAGPVEASTRANRSILYAAYEGPFDLSVSNLVAGTNVLAAELHQYSGSNPDAVFGAELSLELPSEILPAMPPPQSPELHFSRSGSTLLLSWDETDVTLEAADQLGDSAHNWETLASGTNSYSATISGDQRFFRLRSTAGASRSTLSVER